MTAALLKSFYQSLSEIRRLDETLALLDWDRAVNMPEAGSDARAEQVQYISVLVHEKRSSDALFDSVTALEAKRSELSDNDWINVRESKRKIARQRRLNRDFISRQSLLQSVSYDCWATAKPKGDFKSVEKNLSELVALAREEAQLVGYEEHPYDALLDSYEGGAKLSFVKPLLSRLGEGLRKMLPSISEKFEGITPVQGNFPCNKQHDLSLKILGRIGFDSRSGRLDVSPHPFSSTLGHGDWRITTRYHEDNCLSAIYSTLHEAGHAFYEMGLKKEHTGTPLGTAVSLGIHESQSRLWENLIGRSHEFAEFLLPLMSDAFPEAFGKMRVQNFWDQINYVKPSLIRVEADEVSYSLHILIRMLLEEGLITGEVRVEDLPEAWNSLYQKYLGVQPSSATEGVMQDVHWYQGAFGYFPTYALGNLYGICMLETARSQGVGLETDIRAGKFTSLHNWLRTNIYEQGARYLGPQLLEKCTGQILDEKPFLNYVHRKFLPN